MMIVATRYKRGDEEETKGDIQWADAAAIIERKAVVFIVILGRGCRGLTDG